MNLAHGRRPGRAAGAARSTRTSRTAPPRDNDAHGFDYAWWSGLVGAQQQGSDALSPEILGTGFAFKNLDLLLGRLPAGLFARPAGAAASERRVDPVTSALGAAYLVLQVFLTGGLARRPARAARRLDGARPRSTAAASTSGACCAWACWCCSSPALLFALYVPFARWAVDRGRARRSRSGAPSC